METKEKVGPSRGFRPVGKVAEQLEIADALGINVSGLINEVLTKHLTPYYEQRVRESKSKAVKQMALMKEVLDALP